VSESAPRAPTKQPTRKHSPAAPKAKRPAKNHRDLLRLQEDISAKLGAQVVIKPGKKNAGTVVIHYSSLDQLDGILSRW